ncbi:MAG: DUF533 domain-containing protein [Steroidobacteraceae bacterium]
MNEQEARAVMTVVLMAAYADGMKDERERDAVARIAKSVAPGAAVDLAALHRDVLLSPPDLEQVAAGLGTRELRQFAYEMAVGVCEADGSRGPDERRFLGRLGEVLGLAASDTATVHATVEGLASASVEPSGAPPIAGAVLGKASVPDAEIGKMILNAAITNAALELLPETLSSMAIIPLQVRLVYRIGQAYGYPMDATHAKDFIATVGVGLTSQYVEQLGRKLLGGLLGGIAGGLGRTVGRQAASSGLTFATTYALGRVAQRYYAGGRTLDAATLKDTFAALVDEARGLAPIYTTEIQRRASTIDTRSLVDLVRSA